MQRSMIALSLILMLLPGLVRADWIVTSRADFAAGTMSNIEVISPDPDGLDDGAIRLVPNRQIRVLQVYPPGHSTTLVAQKIYENMGLGAIALNFQIDVITITDFNLLSSPTDSFTVTDPITRITSRVTLLDYHIVFFGIADSYGGVANDLSASATTLIRIFAQMGRGVIFTHDTLWDISGSSHPNLNSLTDLNGLAVRYNPWTVFSRVKRVTPDRSDPVLLFPFDIPDTFVTTACHQTGQYAVYGTSLYDGTNVAGTADYGIYWHTYHNLTYDSYCAYFSYGHVEVAMETYEAEAMINTMFFAYRGGMGEGIYQTPIYDAGSLTYVARFVHSETTPGSSAISYMARSSMDGALWTEWIPSAGDTFNVAGGQYYQFEVVMIGDGDNLPVVHSLGLRFSRGGPDVSILEPQPNTWTACPRQCVSLLLQDDNGLDRSSIVLMVDYDTLSITSPGMGLFGGETLRYCPSEPWIDGSTVRVALLEARDIYNNPAETLPDWTFRVDLSAPIMTGVEPPDLGYYFGTNLPEIVLTFADDGSGLDPVGWSGTLNGHAFNHSTPGATWNDGLLTLRPEELGIPVAEQDTLTLSLSVGDSPDYCDPNAVRVDLTWISRYPEIALPDSHALPGATLDLRWRMSDPPSGPEQRLDLVFQADPTVIELLSLTGDPLLDSLGWSGQYVDSLHGDLLYVHITGDVSALVDNWIPLRVHVPVGARSGAGTPITLNRADFWTNSTNSLTPHWTRGFFYIEVVPLAWSLDLTFDPEEAGITSQTVTFGVAHGGTNGFDSGMDRIQPPPPANQMDVWFMLADTANPAVTRLARDIRDNTAATLTWFADSRERPGELSWLPAALPPGIFLLNGTIDMRAVDHYAYAANETVRIDYGYPSLAHRQWVFRAGWNLIGIGGYLPDPHPDAVFGEDCLIYEWVPGTGYARPSALTVGRGYWVLRDTVGVVDLVVSVPAQMNWSVSRGWNLLAGPATVETVPFLDLLWAPPGGSIQAWEWRTRAGYDLTERFWPGYGVWMLFDRAAVGTWVGH